MTRWVVLLLCSISLVFAQLQPQWNTLEGVNADPCVAAQQLNGNPGSTDCTPSPPKLNRISPSGTIVYLPTTNSPTTPLSPSLLAGTQPLTVTGNNFPVPVGPAGPWGTYGLAPPGVPCAVGPDPNLVTSPALAASTQTTQVFNLPTAWQQPTTELETSPRKLCWSPNPAAATPLWRYTGLMVAVSWNCNLLNAALAANPAQNCANQPTTGAPYTTLSALQVAVRLGQTQCCATTTGVINTGTCYNPNVQACCGGAPYNPILEKCCSNSTKRVVFMNDPCPCASNTDCPSVESQCCLPTKYPELTQATQPFLRGQCFNPAVHRCCNVGLRYDPGTFQCCSINGLQSINTPCPCSINLDCWGGQVNSPQLRQFSCCKQTAPLPFEPERCTSYANFPNGTGPFSAQRCAGICMDLTYQICCNGVVCRREFEQCCNNTCCNIFNATCGQGYRACTVGAPTGPGLSNRNNWNEFNLAYEVCTPIQHISTVKAFWIFILPMYLMLSTLITSALALVFVHKAATRQFLVIEKLMVALSILAVLFSVPLFFAPVYKYGIITILVALFSILVAAAPYKPLRIVGIVILLILLIYLYDPFHGNHYLTLASGRTQSGLPDPETAGVWYTTGKSWKNESQVALDTTNHCVQWYGGYFRFDPALSDCDRVNNPNVTTFGYCGRGWVTTLLITEGALLLFVSLLFLCAVLAAILPFKIAYDPIELEVRGTGAVLEYAQ